MAWHPWQPVAPLPYRHALSPSVFAEWLDGGQAFRWHTLPGEAAGADRAFEGGWSSHHVRLRLRPEGAARCGQLEFTTPTHADASATGAALQAYLAGPDADEDALPWRSDAHLAACLSTFPGLRILRQPFGETLLGFVCSATKQIVQIKQMLGLLAQRHGRPLHPTAGDTPAWHALPTWAELAAVPEEALRSCALGFRARHVAGIAAFIAAHPGWLEATERSPYAEAKARLIELPGVGEKIADCVLLFGAGRLEAFPVDTWIVKAMSRRYGLDVWSPAQIAHFGRMHFGPQAGLAQQYLFAYERALARSSS
ncbi:MAG: DNA-binding protein [Verrucomicrobia bacterium]|nr:MAG: DNA-binding protein [Verrucomicrobiota bacterium]